MKGFIINAETRSESNKLQANDAMYFYGVLEDGKNFVWKETEPYILGFVPRETAEKLKKAGHVYRSIPGFEDYRGNARVAVFFVSRGALALGKKILLSNVEGNSNLYAEYESSGEVILESAVPATTQFLTSRGIKSGVKFLSEGDERNGVVYFTNPRIIPEVYLPSLKVLSFDIETGVEEDLLYSVSLVCGSYEKVLVLNKNFEEPLPPKTEWVASEKELLERFVLEVAKLNPHIFTGWFVVGFDFKYMLRKATENNIELPLGIANSIAQAFVRRSGEFSVFIPGRAIVDGMDACAEILTRRPYNMKLGTVAHYLLGVGKTVQSTGMEKVNEITNMYYNDKARLSEYNLVDSRLVLEILEKINAIPYYIFRTALSYLPIEKVAINKAQFETAYLQKLHQKKIVGFDEKMRQPGLPELRSEVEIPGGIYKNVVAFDLANLSILCALQHQLDPLGMAMATLDDENAKRSEAGYLSHKNVNVLGEILMDLFQKKAAIKEGALQSVQQKAVAGHMQALITGLQSKETKFFLPMLLAALRDGTHRLTLQLIKALQPLGKTLFFDSGTLYLQINNENAESFSLKDAIAKSEEIARNFVQQVLNTSLSLKMLEVRRMFRHFYMAPQKCDERRNNYLRYCGVEMDGQVYVRSVPRTAIDIVQFLQTELLHHVFNQYDVESFLQMFRNNLLQGEYDEKLIYKAKLNKSIAEHVHDSRPTYGVRAALKIREVVEGWERAGKRKSVYYVITATGPMPLHGVEMKSLAINYEHYLEKELLPVAGKVLEAAGKARLLSALSGKNKQLDLF